MYTTAWEARRLTLLEWAFVYLCIVFAFLSIAFGCYFTFMTRHGKHRVFLERIEEMEAEMSDDEEEETSTTTTKTALTMPSSATQLLDLARRSSQTRTSQTKTSSGLGQSTLMSAGSASSAVTPSSIAYSSNTGMVLR